MLYIEAYIFPVLYNIGSVVMHRVLLYTPTPTHTSAHIRLCISTHTYTYLHVRLHTPVHTYTHNTHYYTHMYIPTHTTTHTHTHVHAYTHAYTHMYIPTHTSTHSCTYLHTRINAHVHAYTLLHTYTYTYFTSIIVTGPVQAYLVSITLLLTTFLPKLISVSIRLHVNHRNRPSSGVLTISYASLTALFAHVCEAVVICATRPSFASI